MNFKKFLSGVALACSTSFFLLSCQKDNLDVKNAVSTNLKNSGVVADDPAMVAKVPMIASEDFLADHITDYLSFQNHNSNAAPGGGNGKDRTSPIVNITNPLTGSTVINTVSVQVSATDNVGVSSVVLKVDGTVIGTSNTSPYNFSWNTNGLSNGTHTLTATATDAAGNSKVSSIQVGYNTPTGADITPPTVSITSPVNGASISSTISVAVSASDNIGVSVVNIKVDGALVGTTNSAPYNFSWNTTTVAAGIHSLSATAIDAAGNSNTHSIQVTVNTTVIPPVTLPASYQLIMPPVRNQGAEGSCVAFAVAYARSCEQYYNTLAPGYSDATNIFSPEYIFNQVRFNSDCAASALLNSLDLIKNKGVASWQTMPYSDINGCSVLPTTFQDNEAANFKISSYSAIADNDITAIKTMIAGRHPVVFSCTIDQNFYDAGPGFIWTVSGGNAGSHTLTLCGYDDSLHAYKAINSWGTNWGDAGYIWIDYDLFPVVASYYTYAISL